MSTDDSAAGDRTAGGAAGGGPGEGGVPALRIGTAERESAAAALNAHLEAGRLGVEEYADRSAIAANATTADELRTLFVDLPAPHPALPHAGTALQAAGTGELAAGDHGAVAPLPPSPFATWAPRIAAATPILALILFFVLNGVVPNAWLVFLLIPLVGALGFHKSREERREIERDQAEERRRLDGGPDA